MASALGARGVAARGRRGKSSPPFPDPAEDDGVGLGSWTTRVWGLFPLTREQKDREWAEHNAAV